MLGNNAGEAVRFLPDVLLAPEARMAEIDQDWDAFWGAFYAFGLDGRMDEVTEEQAQIVADAKELYFAPDGTIEGPDDLLQLVKYHTDTHFQ